MIVNCGVEFWYFIHVCYSSPWGWREEQKTILTREKTSECDEQSGAAIIVILIQSHFLVLSSAHILVGLWHCLSNCVVLAVLSVISACTIDNSERQSILDKITCIQIFACSLPLLSEELSRRSWQSLLLKNVLKTSPAQWKSSMQS